MRIENDEVRNAEFIQFLEHFGTIPGFTVGIEFFTPSFVNERHDDVDTLGFSLNNGDYPQKIPIVIVRADDVITFNEFITVTVRKNIGNDVDIMTADTFKQGESTFSVIVSVKNRIDKIIRSAVSGAVYVGIALFLNAGRPFFKKNVRNALNKVFIGCMCDYADRPERGHRCLIKP